MTEDLDADDPEPDVLSLSTGWTETSYERGEPGDATELSATLERDTMALEVLPVRYERSGNRVHVAATAGDDQRTFERRGPSALADEVDPTAATALVARYRPAARDRTDVVTVAADPGDALAAAVWLAANTEDDRELERNLRLHRGQQTTATDVAVSDDDALGALFREAPDRCVFTGKPTRSHRIVLPYRYLPALDGAKRTRRGVLRIPGTVRALVGAVSHDAWTERDLDEVSFDAPLERVDAGRYRLDGDVLSAVAGSDAADYVLRRLGDEQDT